MLTGRRYFTFHFSVHFKEIPIKKTSSTHPQLPQLRTAIFIPAIHFALFQQPRKPYHSLKTSILLRCRARSKLKNFKIQAQPELDPSRKARARLTTMGLYIFSLRYRYRCATVIQFNLVKCTGHQKLIFRVFCSPPALLTRGAKGASSALSIQLW